jgi:hypothetical protein
MLSLPGDVLYGPSLEEPEQKPLPEHYFDAPRILCIRQNCLHMHSPLVRTQTKREFHGSVVISIACNPEKGYGCMLTIPLKNLDRCGLTTFIVFERNPFWSKQLQAEILVTGMVGRKMNDAM